MVYRNCRIDGFTDLCALVVDGATLTWLGRQDELGTSTAGEPVDLGGAFVAPAFVDSHVHATGTGLALTGLDLRSSRSLADALREVERASRAARGRPLIGSGWDETRWPEGRAPTATELDRAGYGGSVYLSRVDAHSAVASSALAAAVPGLAGLDGFDGFGRSGQHTRAAHDALRVAAFSALTAGQVRDAQRAALQQAASLGIGSVHEMAGPAISSGEDLACLLDLSAHEPLPEVIAYWGELGGVDTARRLGAVGAAGDLFCDGSLGSHTAALSAPYSDRPDQSGALRFDTRELAEHIEDCIDSGLQAGFHAIGDAAVDQVLDAFELATARLGRPAGVGHRIEHAEMVRDPRRLAASGLVASMQPLFDATWGGSDGMYAARLGPARSAGLNRFGPLSDAGVVLAFGSDAPVTSLGPWAAVTAAVHPHVPDSALSARAAFTAHTSGGWLAAGRPDAGRLREGGPATFAVWAIPDEGGDPIAEAVRLTSAGTAPHCLRTVVHGVTVFDGAP